MSGRITDGGNARRSDTVHSAELGPLMSVTLAIAHVTDHRQRFSEGRSALLLPQRRHGRVGRGRTRRRRAVTREAATRAARFGRPLDLPMDSEPDHNHPGFEYEHDYPETPDDVRWRASVTAAESVIQAKSNSRTVSDASLFVRSASAPIGSAVQSSTTRHR